MTSYDYFSRNNFSEVVGIDEHIGYANSLKMRYKWNENTNSNLERQLEAIKNKQNDNCLNISVIGEFSSGKSTFINAIIGFNLLATNVLQGTTVAITIIEYDEAFSLTRVEYNGDCKKSVFNEIDELKQALNEYTTNPVYADVLSHIIVTVPSNILKSGYRIIDTPGTNSLNLWHEDITERAIRDLSDMSIVTIDAIHPMPQTLLDFMDKYLKKQIRYCSYVLTRIDNLNKDARSEQVEYVIYKATNYFELKESPLVLPFASLELIRTFDESVGGKADKLLLMNTYDSLEKLLKHASQMRFIAQAHKVITLLDSVYSSLDDGIDEIAESLDKEMKMLEKSRVTDLKPFVQSQIDKRQHEFEDAAIGVRQTLVKDLESSSATANLEICNKIDEAENLDSLKSFLVSDNVTKFMQKQGEELTNKVYTYTEKAKMQYYNSMKTFHADFEKEFRRLGIIPPKPYKWKTMVSIEKVSSDADLSDAKNYVGVKLDTENFLFWGGAAAGAVVGTTVFPVIGTVIGGFIGCMLSMFAAPDLDDVKYKTKQKIEPVADKYYKQINDEVLASFDKYTKNLNNQIKTVVEGYYEDYKDQVNKEQQEWENKRLNLLKTQDAINFEKKSIKQRQYSLNSIINKLNNL